MCETERIAAAGAFALDVCCHNRATLTVGPVSLHLERQALDQLTDFVRMAQRRLIVRDEHGDHWREIVRAPDLESDDHAAGS
ncbi:MAG: hypothetical protein AAF628_05195 [Planctomycetota bacterium]